MGALVKGYTGPVARPAGAGVGPRFLVPSTPRKIDIASMVKTGDAPLYG